LVCQFYYDNLSVPDIYEGYPEIIDTIRMGGKGESPL